MILVARAASPTARSLASRYLVPTALPMKTDAITKASQPKTAVFQWPALQRPMRAAKLLLCFNGDMAWDSFRAFGVSSDSAIAVPVGMRRPGVFECGMP